MPMRALAAADRQAEALTVYSDGRELLADQLGLDPSGQLEEVDSERAVVSPAGPGSPPPGDPHRPRGRGQGPDCCQLSLAARSS
jgi:Bacterial transcriptional activator domain